MIDLKLLRTTPDHVRRAVQNRGGRAGPALEQALTLDAELRALRAELEPLQQRRNAAADEVGKLKREKKDVAPVLAEMETVKARLKTLEEKTKVLEAALNDVLLGLPNIPDPSVPLGQDAAGNKVLREWGVRRAFDFKPRDHQALGEFLGMFDFARATKLSGARFALYAGAGARLIRALTRFMLDLHTDVHGYREIWPPLLVNRPTMTGTGQLPKFGEELYACPADDLYLIPTAEVPLTNLYRDEVLAEGDLPRALCAYTPCFRREAGSYGKDTRGVIRNHQFDKVELVRFCRPEDSPAELETLTGHAEEVLKRLEIPHRVVALCTGDLGFSAAKTYDLEVWLPGDAPAEGPPGAWREISSCSTFTDFQARRMNIRLKKSDGGRGFVHTLNGSGLAVGRTLAAVLENYQEADGTVRVPAVLVPYLGVDRLTPEKNL